MYQKITKSNQFLYKKLAIILLCLVHKQQLYIYLNKSVL
ncbi:hypothetical protein ACI8B_50449 [Acinetobacter proteolyticus]|uniref:Uncharacterized protein n=1 Tax=Acinetobacter proteolyticus TaxID=1776741 RepID=A0A653KAM9_9GAMM|nr:hypothetical protein ACI8B_50449 [Acinetobacter proteolyticus]